MLMNGVDYDARIAALAAVGIDGDGPMSQFKDRLGADWVYCNQHLFVHRSDGSCTVGCVEQFPLKATGDIKNALAECRERGFRLTGEPCPCKECGEMIVQPNLQWVTVEGRSAVCPANKNSYRPGHIPVENIPASAAASL